MIIYKTLTILMVAIEIGNGNTQSSIENESDSKDKNYIVNTTDVLVIIRNTHDKLSIAKAKKIKLLLVENAKKLNKGNIEVLMLHEDWAPFGAWTILSIFEKLYNEHKDKKWIYFCEDTTQVHLKGVLRVLSRFDHSKEWFLGHALEDHEPSIIHHFAFHQNVAEFKYPDFDAGWAISIPLLKETVTALQTNPPQMSFSIDVKHEVAKFIHTELQVSLTNIPEFCINVPLKKKNCVSTVEFEEPQCGEVDPDDILVAVKTCEKFHKDRVPVIQKTIGKHAKNIRYYSDVVDDSIPTEYIDVGNTERGHCQKLHNIIKRSVTDEWKDKKWLVVIDDDTIMSYYRLRKHLACYDSEDIVLLGERYGYGLSYSSRGGYEYPTGGGGMILSRGAINKLFERNCMCSSANSPDDMWLGTCFRDITPMVHSNSLHQSKPSQYNREFLSHRYLVSFHKHHWIDPLQVYRDYVEDPKEKKEELAEETLVKEEL